MKFPLKTTYLVFFILICSFQCARWVKYAEDISFEISPDKLISVNDSVSLLAQASMKPEKIDSVKINIYYLPTNYYDQHYDENQNDKIGDITLSTDKHSQRKPFKFKFVEGNSLYAKQIVWKNKKKIESPLLLLIADQPR